MKGSEKTVLVDCDAGRRLGCRTFCCRLLVRLKPHEMEAHTGGPPPKGFVDKNAQGLCIHMDPETGRCGIWETRPEVCREYTCNDDFLLQVALREDFANIAELARKASIAYIPKETFIKVPAIGPARPPDSEEGH
jgi:Fe-S-cluster containining protein